MHSHNLPFSLTYAGLLVLMAKVVNIVSQDLLVNILIQFSFQRHSSAEFGTNIAKSHKWDAMQ